MQKIGLPSTKSLDKFKSLCGSASGNAKPFSFSSRPSSDSLSLGSFANLKLTAEKLVKEQASVKTDLEIANAKLKKSHEHIHVLEIKLQSAFNENSKLMVKHKEDDKLWKGLESKFSSTKTLFDQLTETLQQLASLVQAAEKDKEVFEEKLSGNSEAMEILSQRMNDLSLKLDTAEEKIKIRDEEVEELKLQKEEKDKFCRDEQHRTVNILQEKDAVIKNFQEALATNKLVTESMNSTLEGMQLQLKSKEDELTDSKTAHQKLENEVHALEMCKLELSKKIDISLQVIKDLEDSLHALLAQLVDHEKYSLTFFHKFDQLNSVCDYCFKLVQQERQFASELAGKRYDALNDKFLCMASEKKALQSANEELTNNLKDIQKAQELTFAELCNERQITTERIRNLVLESENLTAKKVETENLVYKAEEKNHMLSENLNASKAKMEILLSKLSTLETESKDNTERSTAEIQEKSEEIETLRKDLMIHEQQADALEKQIIELRHIAEEKDQVIMQFKEIEKKLEDQLEESRASLSASESKLTDAKKQYDLMMENKQLELSRHLKEISQRNDLAINDIRKKYEAEKIEIIKLEKEKSDKVIAELERNYDQKLAERQEESEKYLACIREEHSAQVTKIQQENERKQFSLIADHKEELKRAEIQAETEMREKSISLRNEHEAQMKALRCQHEDECRNLQEELYLQKSKEDRQRALLQLQWRVMGDKPKEEQEVNSKKSAQNYSMPLRSSGAKRNQGSPYVEDTRAPVSKLLNKADGVNSESAMSIPKHHKKVTRHEYEVETSNGRTITKRRKTRSTVMFKDPNIRTPRIRTPGNNVKNPKKRTPRIRTPGNNVKGMRGGDHPHTSNLVDLLTEGSLNPYVDDPYAF